MLTSMTPERVVEFRARTVLQVLLIVIVVAITLEVVWIARHVLAWVVIALFLALALNPLVGWPGPRRTGPPGEVPRYASAFGASGGPKPRAVAASQDSIGARPWAGRPGIVAME